MLECFPYVPIAGHVRIGVAIFSYDGGLTFGVTGDYDEAPDIDVLCDGIEHSMHELVAAAERDARAGRVDVPRAGRGARRGVRAGRLPADDHASAGSA